MIGAGGKVFRAEPYVGFRDYRYLPGPSWAEIDDRAAALIGCSGVAIPSVRVALCWTLEYLRCRRHTHHVLVPRFVGRCILNSLSRLALPVEVPTPQTQVVIAVHQFGFKQSLEDIQAECATRSIRYVEDSPFGLEHREEPGPGSLAKFIGFSKVLPVLKGGFCLSDDVELRDFIKRKRAGWSPWSWPLLGMLAVLRYGTHAAPYSVLGDVAYELYPEARGDNGLLRGNLWRALDLMASFEYTVAKRLGMLGTLLAPRVRLPDTTRLAAIVPYMSGDSPQKAQAAFRKRGFDANLYHFDVARNLFSPRYEQVLLIPINPRIPAPSFESLVQHLASLEDT